MLSPRFRFLLRLVWHIIDIDIDIDIDTDIDILVRTYADLTFLFLSEVYDLFQLVIIVCIILCFYLFSSSGGNFPIQSYWSLSCDHGLHACIVAMS